MTNDTSPEAVNAPHVRAAFINALREEGTKEEAITWLQKTWNERCALEAEKKRLNKANHAYTYIGKDGKSVLARDLENERDALAVERDLWKAKAEVQGYNMMKAELEAQPEPVVSVKPLSLKPLDLRNLLKHAFYCGYIAHECCVGQEKAWTEYDPTANASYQRILDILNEFDSTSTLTRSKADVLEDAVQRASNWFDVFLHSPTTIGTFDDLAAALRERGEG